MDNSQSHVVSVWFDGECPLCVREIALMRRLDKRRRIEFIEIQSAAACPVDRAELMQRFHARERGGEVVSGAAAFAAMWRAIPALRPLGLLAKSRIILSMLEWLYLRFLTVRPWLQRRLASRASA